MKTLTRVSLLAGAAVLAAPAPAQEIEQPVELKFGVYTTDKPTTVYKQFVDILGHLETDVERRLGTPVGIEIVLHKSYEAALQAFIKGEVDFVRFGPASYVLAERAEPGIRLLGMELKGGEKTFNGYIITRSDSGLKSLEDLGGTRFAFGNANSTIGRYLAQSELVDANMFADDFEDYDYLGRHDLVARGVLLGDYDAGSLKSSTYKKANAKGELEIIHTFKNVTKPWIARAGLDDRIFQALSDSLTELNNEEILEGFKVSGFSKATPSDYEMVRNGMAKAEKNWGDTKLKRVRVRAKDGR